MFMPSLAKVKAGDVLSATHWNSLVNQVNQLSDKGTLKVETTHGELTIGAQNTTWAHFQTDRPKFYFNKGIQVHSGNVGSYKNDLKLLTGGTTKMTIAQTGGAITFHDTKSHLIIPNAGKIKLGPWEIRQSGGGDKTSYLHIDRWSGQKHQPDLLRIDWSGNVKANNFAKGSDRRTKKDIEPLTAGLEKIEQMSPVTFKYNGKGNTIKDLEGMGFIAQDLEEIAPYLVNKYKERLNPEDTKEVELLNILPINIIYLLVNGVKELSQKIKNMESHKVERLSLMPSSSK